MSLKPIEPERGHPPCEYRHAKAATPAIQASIPFACKHLTGRPTATAITQSFREAG